MEFFESLSPLTQLLLVVIIIAALFLAVSANNKRNKQKLRGNKRTRFKENIEARRKEQTSDESS